jgi:hypothetical protein
MQKSNAPPIAHIELEIDLDEEALRDTSGVHRVAPIDTSSTRRHVAVCEILETRRGERTRRVRLIHYPEAIAEITRRGS